MTMLEEWRDILTRTGIIFNESEDSYPTDERYKNGILLETDEGISYSDFTLHLIFNKDGSFRSYGVWE